MYDRQANGALPSTNDILLDYDNQGTPVTDASRQSMSGMNMNNRKRFTVLRDKRITVTNDSNGGTTAALNAVQTKDDTSIDWYVKLKGLQTCYKASTNPAVIGDISSGALYLVGIGNVAAAVFALTAQIRLKFVDA